MSDHPRKSPNFASQTIVGCRGRWGSHRLRLPFDSTAAEAGRGERLGRRQPDDTCIIRVAHSGMDRGRSRASRNW
jgi:hypothetical protein